MAYILIIISFIAMGGSQANSPVIDHIDFPSATSCETAKTWILAQLKANKIRAIATCQ